MTVVESSVASAELFDQLAPGLDARTINVIERHKGGSFVQGRGWLVRRALAIADMVGLSVAFLIAMVWWAGAQTGDHVADALELAIFMVSLPAWILAANFYGLYSSDEERTDHSTADDLVGVFHLVTVGQLGPVPGRHVHPGRRPEPSAPADLLAARDPARDDAAGTGSRGSVAARTPTFRTRSSSAPVTSDSWSRASCASIRSTD